MTPTNGSDDETATVMLRTNGTAAIDTGTMQRDMMWSINGQGLCFTTPDTDRDLDDCRTIGWIQGNQFAVFDPVLGNEKIAGGVIR